MTHTLSSNHGPRGLLLGAGLTLALLACGGGGSADAPSQLPSMKLDLVAGGLGGPGWLDASGAQARFSFPGKAVADASGALWVADFGNHVIRKILPSGEVQTIAGKAGVMGAADGIGSEARFNAPYSLAVNAAGEVFITELWNYAIRKLDPSTGRVTTFAGSLTESGIVNGNASEARFAWLRDIVCDGAGNLFVADGNANSIRKVTPGGQVSTYVGATDGTAGSADGAGNAARFRFPHGLALDGPGALLVCDTENQTIRYVNPSGGVITIAGVVGQKGSTDGEGTSAKFNNPMGIAVGPEGTIHVADTENHTIRSILKGAVSTLAGLAGSPGEVQGPGAVTRFDNPTGVFYLSGRGMVVADRKNHMLRLMDGSGATSVLAGASAKVGSADGSGSAARFSTPWALAARGDGSAYVADTNNHTIRLLKPDGSTITLAGQAGSPGGANGTGPAARFSFPVDLAVESKGGVYVADIENHAIRHVTSTGAVSTHAGVPGTAGSADGSRETATFRTPRGLAYKGTGIVYVADTGNHTIRRIMNGEVTTFAGLAGQAGSADGTGSGARFYSPLALALDTSGNLYVADEGNHVIRKITPEGVVTTLAGVARQAGLQDGSGSEARFNGPVKLHFDGIDSLYVAETGNHALRKVKLNGVTTTVAGGKGSGIRLGEAPLLNAPAGLAFLPGSTKVLLITDLNEHSILKLTLP